MCLAHLSLIVHVYGGQWIGCGVKVIVHRGVEGVRAGEIWIDLRVRDRMAAGRGNIDCGGRGRREPIFLGQEGGGMGLSLSAWFLLRSIYSKEPLETEQLHFHSRCLQQSRILQTVVSNTVLAAMHGRARQTPNRKQPHAPTSFASIRVCVCVY